MNLKKRKLITDIIVSTNKRFRNNTLLQSSSSNSSDGISLKELNDKIKFESPES